MSPEPGINKAEFQGKSKEELISRLSEISKRFENLKTAHDKCAVEQVSNRYLVSILESSDDAIIGITLDGTITSWNRGAEKIFGYTADEVIGHPIAISIPKDHINEFIQILKRLEHGESTEHFETVRLRKNGSPVHVLLTVSPIRNEKNVVIGASHISKDISERKRYEEALRESREKFRRIVETAEEGILVLDKNNNITFANQKLADLLGYSVDEMLGRKIFVFGEKEDVGCLWTIIEKHHNDVKIQFDFRFRKKDGSHIWAIVPTTPFFNELGDYTGALYMISDISHHIKTEEELYAAKAEADIYIDLMSHDIRNMNQASLGFIELSLDAMEKGVTSYDEIKRLLRNSLESLNNSSKLIDNVKMLQRQKLAGEMKLKIVDISNMLAEVVKLYEIVPGREIVINYKPVEGFRVMANELLKEVFSNIVGNSIKHSAGPLAIDIWLDKFLTDDKEYYRVNIADNGPGIPDELKTKIFTRFESVTKAWGKGLGLYIVKTLLEDFHGVIVIEDRIPGDYTKGSKFVIILPAIEK